ncbi:serine/threonine-protein kinase fray2-like, partial [Trifolium medium]|nr:serine/threonine-protein kinase fray2-like [Trifolium medium]
CSLFPVLHSVLQTNILQRDTILTLMKLITAGDSAADSTNTPALIAGTEKSLPKCQNVLDDKNDM